MIAYLFKLENFIPKDVVRHVSEIDFSKWAKEGYQALMIDVDNTLIPYDDRSVKPWHLELKKQLNELGFKVILLSNNHPNNIRGFAFEMGFEVIPRATKPFKRGFKKALKILDSNTENVLVIGDQLMTDVYGASRMKMASILVGPIRKKSEKWYTQGFRVMEKQIKSRIQKKYPEIYLRIKENHDF
jgi:HAD superfamily phosphatase (TIGR01668 family)